MKEHIPDLAGINNIIFDFGRVLLNINPWLTQVALAELGYKPQDQEKGGKDDEVVVKLERGQISPNEFIEEVISVLSEGASADEVIKAWNAMLLDYPSKHVNLLQRLKGKYNLYLLSNSNQIHYDSYTKTFKDVYGFELDSMFDKAWYSFKVGMIKPDPEIFKFVLADGKLDPSKTLFIDDTLVHVEAARELGIRSYHLTGNDDISDLIL